ncbi:hypothetical protein PPYR_07470 [Photinus pyralis]|uniref:DUF4794 domain-containing protein n=1 Tax=Photinus pyralis TaxID=7054 RepID=A0A1Y1MEW7_PHOPY|nr:uncharacterized protein LOC116168355 [Photinus pyralis]XP_031340000.1 uncharacterized protein LOC116168355 [Photinus pyralis]KAB0799590.1 hypothetical protein PPYR_07470 [Photinus pyralis]
MSRLLSILNLFFCASYIICAPHGHHRIHKNFYVASDGEAASHTNLGASGGISVEGSATLGGGGGGIAVEKHKVISEKVIDVEVPPEPEFKAQKTVIERTYVPQYAEKTIRVPTYVEKTIRVPSYVEKTVKVPIEPKIIEKEVSREHVVVPAVKVTKEVGYVHNGGAGFSAHAHGGGLFDGIFNIPIQTLGAVNGFLNGLSGGAGFHVGASKGIAVY